MTNVLVPGESGHSVYTVFHGAFAAGDVIEAVEEAGYEEDDYRDFPVWVREPGGDVSLAVFEEDGFFVLGPDGEIRVFLKALDLEEGFVSGEHGLRTSAGCGWGGSLELGLRELRGSVCRLPTQIDPGDFPG